VSKNRVEFHKLKKYNESMKMNIQIANDYDRIEKAIYFLEEHFQRQPNLDEMADVVGLSPFHFQRIFRRWAGISPKRFLQFLSKEYAKDLLKRSNVLDVSLETGLSGPGRLHDLFVHCEAMTPGEYKEQGKGLRIEYGFHPTPFGKCFIAVTERGICSLSFLEARNENKVLEKFNEVWVQAEIQPHASKTKALIYQIFYSDQKTPLSVLCRGTNFQIKVWEALLKIPSGRLVTYKTVAESIHCPRASRAVGTAIGQNSIAYLIPCHRVVRSMGYLGGYRWGIARKRAILAKEAAEQFDNAQYS
jgi:AraC family transcriptional regulator, regulatory protein of adaptative response / methylated-DNA-[protein]-cysteine methyltransferase